VQLVERCVLTAEQAGSVDPDNQNKYWLLKLGSARGLSAPVSTGGVRRFRFKMTSASDILSARGWNELADRYQSLPVSMKVPVRPYLVTPSIKETV